ncbi:MAG: DUF4416 family protein [Desulforegulaceae bacterium]|nr:DUF4416 family protein [Desulforegulaceae bacterium]
MSKPFSPGKGLVVIAIMTNDKRLFAFALKELEKEFGSCFLVSAWLDFSFSDYYENEMGKKLSKRFVCFKNPVNQDSLLNIKHKTYEIENKYLEENKRTINLDPGILTPDNYVLSTFKNFPHRIYLGNSVFAEVEFSFTKNQIIFYDWTYSDYREKEVCDFFLTSRRYLLLFNSIKA